MPFRLDLLDAFYHCKMRPKDPDEIHLKKTMVIIFGVPIFKILTMRIELFTQL